mmetsp:Transcript_19/g.69  ORF Transcript_19/g.69 Transcript_19/m.69 type:complete len:142 (+) Transcript_19:713-1138(+)
MRLSNALQLKRKERKRKRRRRKKKFAFPFELAKTWEKKGRPASLFSSADIFPFELSSSRWHGSVLSVALSASSLSSEACAERERACCRCGCCGWLGWEEALLLSLHVCVSLCVFVSRASSSSCVMLEAVAATEKEGVRRMK